MSRPSEDPLRHLERLVADECLVFAGVDLVVVRHLTDVDGALQDPSHRLLAPEQPVLGRAPLHPAGKQVPFVEHLGHLRHLPVLEEQPEQLADDVRLDLVDDELLLDQPVAEGRRTARPFAAAT